MSLSKEYNRKLENFIENLPKKIYTPIDSFGFEGFFTYDHLSLEEAVAHERAPFSVGEKWGNKWEYGWFFSKITIPEACRGERIVMTAQPGECIVFVNGEIYGSFDREHTHITLTPKAEGGESFELIMEVYAGHSDVDLMRKTHNNFVASDKDLEEFPEDVPQRVIKPGSFGIMDEDVFALWMDILVLKDIIKISDPDLLRTAKIEAGLMKMMDAVDLELRGDEFAESIRKGREILRPLLECKNGSTAPVMYAVGHSHLDLEWLWTTEETRRKAARTLGNQLQLIKEYPDYKYFQSQAWIFESVKNDYPKLYEEVKKAVKAGNIVAEGASWVEPDCNVTAGESLVRQFLFGKKLFWEEFGIDSKLFWLPDSFGITGSLPQILKGCGIDYFMNGKIVWLYNGGDDFPYSNFNWKGIDGSEIFGNIVGGYGSSNALPRFIYTKWKDNPEKAEVPMRLVTYGYSDGGGGATRHHLEAVMRQKDLEGVPKVIHESPVKLYDDITAECVIENTYVGELYYACHRGTYTSQAKTKKLNRLCEFSLRDAELWGALLGKAHKVETDALWKTVLFNQFHDILPGSSITAVHELAEQQLSEVKESAAKLLADTLETVPDKQRGAITLFNSLSWPRASYVELPDGITSVKDEEGNSLLTQSENGKTYAFLSAPALGYATYYLGTASAEEACHKQDLILENEYLRAEFDKTGALVSLFDKEKGLECLSAPSNIFRLYGDAPTFFDAWDIDSFYEKTELPLEEGMAQPEFDGPLCSSILITKKIHHSSLRQRVSLKKESRHLDFETEIDWQETHKLLKVDFNTNIHTDDLISEIQFGHIKRPTHRNRRFDADRFEVWQQKWSGLWEARRGVALLNDCKYGLSADGGRMSLTLLKAAAEPALNADKGLQTFVYGLMPCAAGFDESGVIRAGYEFNIPLQIASGAAEQHSFLEIDQENIILETVKLAEDGSGDRILRLYEAQNNYTSCTLRFGMAIKEAILTNMLEKGEERLSIDGNSVALNLKPFEIITLRIKV